MGRCTEEDDAELELEFTTSWRAAPRGMVAAVLLSSLLFIHTHICSAPHLEMDPKRFTLAAIALFSASALSSVCYSFSSLCALVVCDSK